MPRIIGVQIESEGGSELKQTQNLWRVYRQHKRTYIVLGDDLDDTDDDILNTAGVPALFTVLQDMLCRKLTPKMIEQVVDPVSGSLKGLWHVDCEFDNEIDPSQTSTGDPTSLRPEVVWNPESEEIPLNYDARDRTKAVVNKAGEKLLETTLVATPVLQITRYEVWPFDPANFITYANRTNATSFYGFDAGVGLMMPMQVSEAVIDGDLYQKVQYTIKFRVVPDPDNPAILQTEPWKARPLHVGTKHLVQQGGKNVFVTNTDLQGNPTECRLDANGIKLAPDANPVYLEFYRFCEAEFNDLSLGPFLP